MAKPDDDIYLEMTELLFAIEVRFMESGRDDDAIKLLVDKAHEQIAARASVSAMKKAMLGLVDLLGQKEAGVKGLAEAAL